jgi:hypothetical protein
MKMHAAHRPGGHRCSAAAVRPAAALATAGCAVVSQCSPTLTVQGVTFSGVVAPKRQVGGAGSPAFRHAVTVCGGPLGLRVHR